MKKLCFALLIFSLLSCEKNTDNSEQATIKRYKMINANISSVISFSTFGDCPSIPTPRDSTASIKIDVNGDSINDFLFDAHHFQCGNTHCLFFTYSVSMRGIKNSDSIRVDKLYNAFPEKLNSTIDISKNGLWKNSAQLLLNSPCTLPFETDFKDSYIGIRVNDNYGWIRITPFGGNGVKIIEYAINLQDNSTINAGQKK